MTAELWHSPGYPTTPTLVATVNVPRTAHCPDYVLWSGRLFRCVFESAERGATYIEERLYVCEGDPHA